MSSDLQPGALLAGHYVLEHKLGEGAFGDVWRALQMPLERSVAVKLLKVTGDRLALKRFDHEARALASINHLNCVTLYDFGHLPDGDGSYLVTELVDGVTLRDWMESRPSLAQILGVAGQLVAALEAAHRQNVVHRDLKPENVMVVADPQQGLVVKVLDFGLSKIVDDERHDITQTGETFGTPGYMSPEQMRGSDDLGLATDQYSLGVILFEMLEGRPPFTGASGYDVCMKHLTEPVPELHPAVAPRLRAIVRRLLSKQPRERYANAAAVAHALEQVGQPESPRPVATTRRASAPAHPEGTPSRAGWLLLPLVVVAVVGLGVVMSSEPEPPRPVAARRAATGIVSAPPVDVGAPATDLGRAPNTPPGCGKKFELGTQKFAQLDGLERTEIAVHVPKGYDPNTPAPVLMLLHESLQRSDETMARFTRAADEHGFVLLAPDDLAEGPQAWERPSAWRRAWDELGVARSRLCLADDRVYIFGYGAGGWAAENIACAHPAVRAVVTHAHRLTLEEEHCRPSRDIPYLFMAPMKDGWDPVDGGGSNCPMQSPKRSLDEHEGMLREERGCGIEKRDVSSTGAHTCYSYDGCEVPLRVCRIEAGRFWPKLTKTVLRTNCDRGAAADFAYEDTLWDFILSVDQM